MFLSREARARLKDILVNRAPRPESHELNQLLLVVLGLILDMEKLEAQLEQKQAQLASLGAWQELEQELPPATLLASDDMISVQEKMVLLKRVNFVVDQVIGEIHTILGRLSSSAEPNTSKLN